MARPSRRMYSLATTLGLLAASCWALGVVAPPAVAASCGPKRGVLVVVDFGELGGGVQRGCAPGDPASGLKALHAAGFTTAGTQAYGSSFVCRIDGKPDKSREACVDTPPGDAHWAYWHAAKSGWVESQRAVTGYDPEPGSVEGWSFGGGERPSMPVASVRSASSRTSDTPTPATDAASQDAGTPTPTSATTRAADGGTGSSLPTLAAIALIAAGAVTAVLVALRRRRRGG